MNQQQLTTTMEKYVPPGAAGKLVEWILQYNISLKLTKERKSKFGDYRPPYGRFGHRITINHNLNPYQFLITLVHEIAHLVTWEQYQQKVSPHGKEWKKNYQQLLQAFLGKELFPTEIEQAVHQHLRMPTASSSRDEALYKLLRNYDLPTTGEKNDWQYVEDLPHQALFQMEDGRVFRKEEKLRKYYRCVELKTMRYYRVSGIAQAKLIRKP